jgi:hypothetical protein
VRAPARRAPDQAAVRRSRRKDQALHLYALSGASVYKKRELLYNLV